MIWVVGDARKGAGEGEETEALARELGAGAGMGVSSGRKNRRGVCVETEDEKDEVESRWVVEGRLGRLKW
jgi:hypothetical protein